MKTLSVTQFRAQCLNLLDSLPAEGILITKRGRPVAKVMPIRRGSSDLIGILKDLVLNPQDDLLSAYPPDSFK
ncbi:MAG: type II toxin-antitoxin system prevent-host-death family antitoxin [Bryobacteraceae bacterium]